MGAITLTETNVNVTLETEEIADGTRITTLDAAGPGGWNGEGSFEAKGTPFLDVEIEIKYLGDWPPPRGDVAKGTLEVIDGYLGVYLKFGNNEKASFLGPTGLTDANAIMKGQFEWP